MKFTDSFEYRRLKATWRELLKVANVTFAEDKISIKSGTDVFGNAAEIVTPEFYIPNCQGRCKNIFLTFDIKTAELLYKLNMPAMALPTTFPVSVTAKELFLEMGNEIGNESDGFFNCFFIDGDWFGCAPLILTAPDGKGVLSLCGDDSSYYECDKQATERAYTHAQAFYTRYGE